MKNLDQLIEYLQRELNTKRFLVDSIDFLNVVRSLEGSIKELEKQKDDAQRKALEAVENLNDTETMLKATKGKIKEAEDKADAIVAEATTSAAEIMAQARKDAQAEIDTAKLKAAKVDSDTDAVVMVKKALGKEVDHLTKTRDELKAEIDKLKKKFSE